MSLSVSLEGERLRRGKILGESNSKNFGKHGKEFQITGEKGIKKSRKVTKNTFGEENNGKKVVVGVTNKKPPNMVLLVSKESSHKIHVPSIKTQVLEPVFVAANVEEIKIRRNIHTQMYLSYLKSFHDKNNQNTISNWNVKLKKRLTSGCKINSGKYMLGSDRNNSQDEVEVVDALYNLYNNVTQEILDTVNVCRDISISTL
ncbi:Hypothetical protein SRAE_2000329700 [Strongyloides ratti]|uniref:Uncharacterized protein n=1 Tax=Strongyloides ratti TaxID=34506 RepID=A0A090LFV6_STRRB|nr:Hypothetical protein SRAE_2000329700 [Strongyloides ratti]CEF68642.1 Hypothetical protein SRAE_2000329700 [Strongyloides ratti]